MKNLKINEIMILERINIIQRSLRKLEDLKPLTRGKFALEDNFAIAEHHLRYALEATFDISSHILSRIPGTQADEYKKMALEMGIQKIVPEEFAKNHLFKMAGYRNRLTHFYFEVTPEEIYTTVQNDLGDFDIFSECIKKLLAKQKNNT